MNIYIHVEISVRELDSKLLLATIAASKGHQVIISDIETIISQAQKYLQIEGMLLIEHGYNQANKVKEIFLNYKFHNIKQHKDINNKIRSSSGIKI